MINYIIQKYYLKITLNSNHDINPIKLNHIPNSVNSPYTTKIIDLNSNFDYDNIKKFICLNNHFLKKYFHIIKILEHFIFIIIYLQVIAWIIF